MAMLIAHPGAPMVRARKLAETGGALLLVAIVAIVASAIRQHVAAPAMEAASAGYPWRDILTIVVMNATLALPSVCLILALLALRKAVRGCFMGAAAGAALRRAGAWALVALAAKIVVAPTLYGSFELAPLGLVIAYETFDLGMIGLAALLMLAGSVIETAASRGD
jgi:hypothetical protein